MLFTYKINQICFMQMNGEIELKMFEKKNLA